MKLCVDLHCRICCALSLAKQPLNITCSAERKYRGPQIAFQLRPPRLCSRDEGQLFPTEPGLLFAACHMKGKRSSGFIVISLLDT